MTWYEDEWASLTPEQRAAVAVEHRTWKRINDLKKTAQALLNEAEEIARRLQDEASPEVRETLERRGWEIVARIYAIGDLYKIEDDFFHYVDDYCDKQGIWDSPKRNASTRFPLDADYLMAFALTFREAVSFETLQAIKVAVEKTLPEVCVAFDQDAIASALQRCAEIAERTPTGIRRSHRAMEHLACEWYMACHFVIMLPPDLHPQVHQIIQDHLGSAS